MYPRALWMYRLFVRNRKRSRVEFTEQGIEFHNYDFFAASVYPSGVLPYSQIKLIDWKGSLPEVHTVNGEILFVPAWQREELRQAAETNSIPVGSAFDVWGNILDPFLDTEFSKEDERKTLERLAQVGLSESRVMEIRDRVGAPMIALNSVWWNWWFFGLYDVLNATQAAMKPEEYRKFYLEAMQIAQIPTQQDSASPLSNL